MISWQTINFHYTEPFSVTAYKFSILNVLGNLNIQFGQRYQFQLSGQLPQRVWLQAQLLRVRTTIYAVAGSDAKDSSDLIGCHNYSDT